MTDFNATTAPEGENRFRFKLTLFTFAMVTFLVLAASGILIVIECARSQDQAVKVAAIRELVLQRQVAT